MSATTEAFFLRTTRADKFAFWFDGRAVTGITFYAADGHVLLTVRAK